MYVIGNGLFVDLTNSKALIEDAKKAMKQ